MLGNPARHLDHHRAVAQRLDVVALEAQYVTSDVVKTAHLGNLTDLDARRQADVADQRTRATLKHDMTTMT